MWGTLLTTLNNLCKHDRSVGIVEDKRGQANYASETAVGNYLWMVMGTSMLLCVCETKRRGVNV